MIIPAVLPELPQPGNVTVIIAVAIRSRRMVLETTVASGKDAFHTPRTTGSMEPVRLLACPFYKYDRRRFSEFNYLEKKYRGCSSAPVL